jgi:hypothetical protein
LGGAVKSTAGPIYSRERPGIHSIHKAVSFHHWVRQTYILYDIKVWAECKVLRENSENNLRTDVKVKNTLLSQKEHAVRPSERRINECCIGKLCLYVVQGGVDKSLARPGRKQATAREDFEFHVSYL